MWMSPVCQPRMLCASAMSTASSACWARQFCMPPAIQVWVGTMVAYMTVSPVHSSAMQVSHCIYMYILGQQRIKFNPSFPPTCPFVTAVGETQMKVNSTVYDPESACEKVTRSGGGFSNIFSMPGYQRSAVLGYLNNNPPPYTAQQYNNSGMVLKICPSIVNPSSSRADVSARSAGIQIYLLTGHSFFCNRTILPPY